MKISEAYSSIIQELGSSIDDSSFERAEQLVSLVLDARRIFVLGAGRSGFMVKAFAMRLAHMGFDAYVVGETVTPGMDGNDVLLIGSGSGETASLTAIARNAKKTGGKIALATISPSSTIGLMADLIIPIRGVSPKIGGEKRLLLV